MQYIYVYIYIYTTYSPLGTQDSLWKTPEALAFGLALMVLPAWKWYILPMLHGAHEEDEDHATWTPLI